MYSSNITCTRRISLAMLIGFCSACFPAFAAPHVPTSDSATVEVLRDRPLSATNSDFRRLRAKLRDSPADIALATNVARRAIEISRHDGDPRFLGYAQAALAPWWQQANPPVPVRLLKAILLQSTHAFAPALGELDAVLQAAPDNAQAWLIRAAILQVQGDYSATAVSCERLRATGAVLYADVCKAELTGLTGDVAAARRQLAALSAASAGTATPAEWLAVIEAEMAERAGDDRAAEKHYRAALSSGGDAYSKAAYADFLLDRKRGREVIALLANDQRADALLLRLAIAYRSENDPRLAAAVSALKARFDAARLRGDIAHQREEARFTLQLLDRPIDALSLAQQNWSVQKESADARILLEAARAAGQDAAANPVREFIRSHQMVDRRLAVFL